METDLSTCEHSRIGGSDILLCYACDARLSTMDAMNTAMELIHTRYSCAPNSSKDPKHCPNVEISPTEKAIIFHSLSDLQVLLARHEFELERLRDVISLLSTSHEALARRMEDVKSLVAPINSLPDEIIGEIFRMYFSEQMDGFRYRSYGRIKIPLEFTQVCKRWREVALATPRIWTDVTALTDMHLSEGFVRDLTIMFLERSQFAPLKVKLYLPLTSRLWAQSSSRVVSGLLLAHSTRWSEADVAIDLGDVDASSSRQGLHGTFPLLKHLSLGGKFASERWRQEESSDSPRTAISLHNAPLLTHLTLNLRDSLSTTEMSRAINLPWYQIRTLRCHYYSFVNLDSSLRLCTNVEEAVFLGSITRRNVDNGSLHGPSSEDNSYTCTALRRMSLTVTFPLHERVSAVLQHLRAPGLLHLELTFLPLSRVPLPSTASSSTPTMATFLADDVVSFIAKSYCYSRLKHLTLCNLPKIHLPAETLIALFQSTPALEALVLGFVTSSSEESLEEDFGLDQETSGCNLPQLFDELRTTPVLPALIYLRILHFGTGSGSKLARDTLRMSEKKALFDMLEIRRRGIVIGNDTASISSSVVAPLEKMYLDDELIGEAL